MTSSEIPLEPWRLDELKRAHRVGDDWEPRFVADLRVAVERAEEYERMGLEVEIYPHPDDVPKGSLPELGDRCVIYTRPRAGGDEGGGLVDDSLL